MHSGEQTVLPVAHGDVKPGNIVMRDDGSTVLVDLGLMRISDGTVVAGATAPYAAPELFLPGAFTSPEADRFAFAATVAHIVLGEAPPVGDAGEGPDLRETQRLLERRPLTATRPILRHQVMQALTAAQDKRPAHLSRWLSSLTDSISHTTLPAAEPHPPGHHVPPDHHVSPGPGRNKRRVSVRLAATLATAALTVAIPVSLAIKIELHPAVAGPGIGTTHPPAAGPSSSAPEGHAPTSPPSSPSPTVDLSQDTQHILQGPWHISGSGVNVNVESVTRLGDILTVPVVITSSYDVANFSLSIFDQAGNPLQQAGGSSWIDPQARATIRNILKITIDPSAPPTKITLSMKGFFWSDSQRLILTLPSP
jgi:serine/threonine protein kinase